MFWNVLIISLAGGIFCLDRIFLQVMISRPVVAGPAVGLILHDPLTGLLCGALLELLWIDRLPIGTYVPPNDTIVTVIITAAAIMAGNLINNHSRELATFCILLFFPLGYAARQMDTRIIQFNDRLSREAVAAAERGDVRGVSRRHLLGMLISFAAAVLFIFTFLYPGVLLAAWFFPLLPQFFMKALTLCYYFLPLLGVAVAIRTVKRQGMVAFFCAVFVAVLVIMEFAHGLAK
jgi:PTS system mannose-specific IIC component